MAGISDKALKAQYAENKYRYNDGTELANKEFSDGSGLELYETGYRSYDPQIGRFHQIDPIGEATEDWSPYAYALDNPIFFNDPMGLAPNDSTVHDSGVKPMAEVTVTAAKKDCKTCNAPSVAAGIPKIDPSTNPLRPVPNTPPGKVIPINEPVVVPLLPGLTPLSGGLTIVGVFLPLSTGQEGIPAPNPLFSPQVPDSKRDDDGLMTLYRGVDPSNPNFKYALGGMAVPLGLDGGHNDPNRHNTGDTYSIFTSWTSRPAVAAKFAGRYGVVLVKKFQITPFMNSPDAHGEQEILVPGIVTGAAVHQAWTTRRL